jgi:hypothetical protein
MPRWILWTIAALTLSGFGFVAITAERVVIGEGALPAPLSSIVVITLVAAVLGLLARGYSLQSIRNSSRIEAAIIGHMDEQISTVAARHDRRMDLIAGTMIKHGILMDSATVEIPRQSAVRAYASVPGGPLDPKVVEITDRLARRITGNLDD